MPYPKNPLDPNDPDYDPALDPHSSQYNPNDARLIGGVSPYLDPTKSMAERVGLRGYGRPPKEGDYSDLLDYGTPAPGKKQTATMAPVNTETAPNPQAYSDLLEYNLPRSPDMTAQARIEQTFGKEPEGARLAPNLASLAPEDLIAQGWQRSPLATAAIGSTMGLPLAAGAAYGAIPAGAIGGTLRLGTLLEIARGGGDLRDLWHLIKGYLP